MNETPHNSLFFTGIQKSVYLTKGIHRVVDNIWHMVLTNQVRASYPPKVD